MSKMRANARSWAWSLAVLAVAAGLGAWWGKGARNDENAGGQVRELSVPEHCNAAQQPCTARGDGVSVTFGLPQPVRPMEPFPVHLEVTGEGVSGPLQASVSFSMRGMDMGVNRYGFQPEGEGRWSARATLPVCSHGRRDWLAEVDLRGGNDRHWRAGFELTTQ